MRSARVSATTDTAGDGIGNGTINVLGVVHAIKWDKGTCDTGVDITVSVQKSDAAGNLLVVANADASKLYYPRSLQHLDTDGSNLTTHTRPLACGTVRLVIAQGGNTKTGAVIVFYE